MSSELCKHKYEITNSLNLLLLNQNAPASIVADTDIESHTAQNRKRFSMVATCPKDSLFLAFDL